MSTSFFFCLYSVICMATPSTETSCTVAVLGSMFSSWDFILGYRQKKNDVDIS